MQLLVSLSGALQGNGLWGVVGCVIHVQRRRPRARRMRTKRYRDGAFGFGCHAASAGVAGLGKIARIRTSEGVAADAQRRGQVVGKGYDLRGARSSHRLKGEGQGGRCQCHLNLARSRQGNGLRAAAGGIGHVQRRRA